MTTFGSTAVARLAQDKLAQLTVSDPLAEEVAHFQAQIAADSLHRRVADALSFQSQGHFDKAMLAMSEANRDQVTALRRIQALLARVEGGSHPVPVLEKFRQVEPFAIGLGDADPVLGLLEELTGRSDPRFQQTIRDLHECEARLQEASDYLSFLKRRAAPQAEIEAGIGERNDLHSAADAIRAEILEPIFDVAIARTAHLTPGRAPAVLVLALVENLFQVMTSAIATRPADAVDL